MKHPDMAWRTMTDLDLGALETIARVVHPDFFEAREVLAEKRSLYPNGAHVLELGDRIVGYFLSHPWRTGNLPPLNDLLGAIPDGPDTFHIHDLAILPVARRMGAAGFMLGAMTKHAATRGFASMSLVAVNNSEGFWAAKGFDVSQNDELAAELATTLAGYGPGARYMVRPL